MTVQQRKEKKAGNAVSNSSQGNNKSSIVSGGPVALTRVSSFGITKIPRSKLGCIELTKIYSFLHAQKD